VRFEAILPRVMCTGVPVTMLGTWVGVATQSAASPASRALGEALALLLVTAAICGMIFMLTEPLKRRRELPSASRRRRPSASESVV
jgi:Na+-translocating ferredoxin:NAD+ oxidoreductase RnfD subunit